MCTVLVWLGEEEGAEQMFPPPDGGHASYTQTPWATCPARSPEESVIPQRRMRETCMFTVNVVT